jgi:hypothetical protein
LVNVPGPTPETTSASLPDRHVDDMSTTQKPSSTRHSLTPLKIIT